MLPMWREPPPGASRRPLPQAGEVERVRGCTLALLRQRVVLLERRLQVGQGGIRIGAGLFGAVTPSLDQGLGGLLPGGRLLRSELVDLVILFRLDLVDTGVLELAPVLAD